MVILVMPEPSPAYATFKGAASNAKKIAPHNMTPNALRILIALAFRLLTTFVPKTAFSKFHDLRQ
jgi:hypothetical protein